MAIHHTLQFLPDAPPSLPTLRATLIALKPLKTRGATLYRVVARDGSGAIIEAETREPEVWAVAVAAYQIRAVVEIEMVPVPGRMAIAAGIRILEKGE